jgi:hypothetical protein
MRISAVAPCRNRNTSCGAFVARDLACPEKLFTSALVNAGRAFVTIGAAAMFWIVSEWPNGTGRSPLRP